MATDVTSTYLDNVPYNEIDDDLFVEAIERRIQSIRNHIKSIKDRSMPKEAMKPLIRKINNMIGSIDVLVIEWKDVQETDLSRIIMLNTLWNRALELRKDVMSKFPIGISNKLGGESP